MKKNLFVLTMAISMLLLSACGGTTDSSPKQSKVGQEKENVVEDVVKTDNSFNTGEKVDETKKKLSVEEADFRSLKWGMTKDEVQYYEGTGYRETDENTMYYTRVREEDFPADAEYKFLDGKLVQGIFYITHNKSDNAIAVEDFVELVNSLKARFGDPKIADLVYVNESDKTEDTKEQLELVKQGLLQFRTGWMLDDTELRVVMFPKSGEACIGLQYKQAGVEVPAE